MHYANKLELLVLYNTQGGAACTIDPAMSGRLWTDSYGQTWTDADRHRQTAKDRLELTARFLWVVL